MTSDTVVRSFTRYLLNAESIGITRDSIDTPFPNSLNCARPLIASGLYGARGQACVHECRTGSVQARRLQAGAEESPETLPDSANALTEPHAFGILIWGILARLGLVTAAAMLLPALRASRRQASPQRPSGAGADSLCSAIRGAALTFRRKFRSRWSKRARSSISVRRNAATAMRSLSSVRRAPSA